MKSAESDEPTIRGEALADRAPPGIPPGLIHIKILATTALALLAAWSVYKGLKYPEHRLHDVLWAVLCLLYVVLAWVSKPSERWLASKPNWVVRRLWAAFGLLFFVLGFIAFDYVTDLRRQAAAEALAQRKEVWRQSVERQREAVELAKQQVSDASIKEKAALDAMIKTGVRVKLPGGKSEGRFDPEAYRKWKEAMDESQAAMKRHFAEIDRLLRVQLEQPGRFGRP